MLSTERQLINFQSRFLVFKLEQTLSKSDCSKVLSITFLADGFGNWSTEGCSYMGTTKSGHVTCHCNHMTNFAILLTADPERDEKDSDHRHVLSVISYVGCGVSFIAVILTLVTYVFFR
jgi:hypothetical protein